MDSDAILIPGGLRLRGLHPLFDRSGSCSLLYDLERNALVEVPVEYQYHIAAALDTGDLDEDLLGWLASEDLLTYEGTGPWATPGRSAYSEISELSLGSADSGGFGCVYFFDNQVHCRISPVSEAAAFETLDFLFRRSSGGARITLHLDAVQSGLDFDLLRRIVAEAERRAERAGQDLAYELTVHGDSITEEIALFLKEHPFRVRVRCDGPPVPGVSARRRTILHPSSERGLGLLLRHLPDSVTVHAVLRGGARLADLWAWAKQMGLRHLNATKLGAQGEISEVRGTSHESEVRAFRRDLAAICEEMFLALEAGRPTPLYEPLVRGVRQLAATSPFRAGAGGGGYLGLVANGKVFPLFRQLATVPGEEGGMMMDPSEVDRDGVAAAGGATPCHACWARRLCRNTSGAEAVSETLETGERSDDNCDFWRAELEAGLLFYQRVSAADPAYCLGLADNAGNAFDTFRVPGPVVEWKTC